MTLVYIGIGSNIEREKHVEAGMVELAKLGNQLRLSTIYECEAVGFEAEPYFNLVVELQTSLTLTEFSHQLRNIEFKLGRESDAKKNQSRTLDLDILLFGEQVSEASPQLPRNDIFKFGFVIEPLKELCPDLVVPSDGRTIFQIWKEVSYNEQLMAVDQWFDLPNP